QALIQRDVLDAATLAKEIEEEVGNDVQQLPLWLVFGTLHEAIEVVHWCKDAHTAQSVLQKQGQINTLRDNVIKLEHVLWQKDTTPNHRDYWRFMQTPPMRAFHQLDRKPPTASSRPTACPSSAGKNNHGTSTKATGGVRSKTECDAMLRALQAKEQ